MVNETSRSNEGDEQSLEERVLVLLRAPEANNGIGRALREGGLVPVDCADADDLCAKISGGAGAILIDDVTLRDCVQPIDQCLCAQPAWSDVPVLLLSRGGEALQTSLDLLRQLKSSPLFSILTLPIEETTLINATEVALRGRRHQYEVRDLLKELQTSKERFRLIVDSAIEYAIFSMDSSGCVTSWNSGAQRLLGYGADEILGQKATVIFTEEDRRAGALETEMNRALTTGRAEDERWHVRKDGSRFWAGGQVNPMFGPEGEVKGFIKILRDYTGRRRTESWLKALNETLEKRVEERTAVAEQRATMLRRLTNELTNAEQRERRRLAQILHDHLQQLLVAAKMQVGMLVMREDDSSKEENLHQIENLLKRSIDSSRSLTVELSPPILYDAGLAPALEWLTRRMRETHGLDVNLQRETELNPREENVRVFLFEAIRELLFNVVKHSGATEATVTMRQDERRHLEVIVSDPGRGFGPREITLTEGGFGLFSIRERIELLGGSLELLSNNTAGTRVILRVPVAQAEPLREEAVDRRAALEEVPREPEEEEPAAERDRVRILLADDHKILREGLAGLLREQPDFDVVSEASDGQMAVNLAQETRPDVIVMDVTMPRLNGIDATRRILQEMPHVKVIALSMHEKEDMAHAMREAGAVAYVTKGAPSDILTATIRDCAAAAKGAKPAPPGL